MGGSGLTVASVLWVGEFRGREYGPEWVRRLRNMVARNLDGHHFVCLTNTNIKGVDCIPIPDDRPGWWAKTHLWEHDFGRTLYLDLDTLIVDRLEPIAEYPASFAAMPPSYTFMGGKPAGGKGVVDRYQSSCMVWDTPPPIRYEPWWGESYRGDQDALSDLYTDGETMPPEWFQKLKRCHQGPPKGVKVILSMPWKNNVAARKFEWVNEIWQ